MALPREPRQKLINLMYLVLTAMLAINVSMEVIDAFSTVDNSLQNSNKNLDGANNTLFTSLEEKLKDPKTATQAAKWKPKADSAGTYSTDMVTYIESLKKEIINASVATKGDTNYKKDDLNASSMIMDEQKKGTELYNKLVQYKQSIFGLDSSVPQAFRNSFAVNPGSSAQALTNQFRNMPSVAAVTLLSKYQNDVKNAENQVVTMFHNKVGQVAVIYDQFSAIVGQSSTYVMPGDKISITAGVGAYSTSTPSQISIGGSSVPVNADGVASREVTAEGSGKKSVPVVVSYIKPDGTKESKSYTVEYTVGQPGVAAVMLDKMNVFYIGLDNPITVGSPAGWDKTSVSISGGGGTLSGSGPKRTVRVSSPGSATITVTADGKPSQFNFRCKTVPDPEFKVATGTARMATSVFKSQDYCRVDYGGGFEFDLKSNVISATVYFSGAGFPSVQQGTIQGNSLANIKALMQKCQPGSSVTFDNIKVQKPEGVKTIESRAYQLY